MHPSDTPTRPPSSTGPAFDPVALRAAWRELLARSPHLHGPEAAARLGVPEADLLASRIGDGVRELSADLPALLAPCADWGKLLVAARNRIGVALAILDDCTVVAGPDAVCIEAGGTAIRIDPAAASVAYLFEDHDAHGHTVSVNWFDSRGEAVGKLFLMSKSGRDRALPHLLAHAAPGASAERRAARGPAQPRPPTVRMRGEMRASRVVEGVDARMLGERAVLERSWGAAWRVSMEAPGIGLDYTGPLARSSHTPPAVHANDERLKLHLRMGQAARARAGLVDAGHGALKWEDDDGGSLVLAVVDGVAASHAWVDAMLAGRSA